MDEQIKPVAWKCVWIVDGDGCHWEQYHDEDDPMPERWDDAPDEITPLYSQQSIDALRAEVEALRADAERYRWLRVAHGSHVHGMWHVRQYDGTVIGQQPEELDAAIDAARKGE